MRRTGTLDTVLESLEHAGVTAALYDRVSPDPKSDEVDEAVELARREDCDVIVGLGGGSALDAAKAAGVAVNHDTVREIIGRTLDPHPGSLPVVAIPTTAGSGAEVTKGSIVTDTVRSFKSGIRGEDVFPAAAIVDPALTETMPSAVAAETGFDALTHAVESYVARKANPITDSLSERAIALIAENVEAASNGVATSAARERMCVAALLGGLNVATASTCLPHRLQQAMGSVSRIRVSHGRGLAALYPAWLERAYPHARERFDRIGALLGDGDARAAIAGLRERLGLATSLAEHGYAREDIDAFMDGVSGNVENDPIDGIDRDLMRGIYEDAY